MKALLISSIALLIILLALSAQGYERYHAPGTPGLGYCAACHPGFTQGTMGSLHVKHVGGSAPMTPNCNLCHTTGSGDNPLTMWSALGGGIGLGCVGCHGRDYGETITANYGGFPTAGKAKSSGYGLRKHHLNKGEALCLSCHADVPQSFIKPEYVNPEYYARIDVLVNNEPAYAADNEDTDNDPDNLGLVMHYAFCVNNPFDFASHSTGIHITP